MLALESRFEDLGVTNLRNVSPCAKSCAPHTGTSHLANYRHNVYIEVLRGDSEEIENLLWALAVALS